MKKVVAALLGLICLGLIALLIFGPAMVEKSQNVVLAHQPYEVSEAAKELHQSLLIGDWHADTTLWNRDLRRRSKYGQLDIPRMQAGNQALQMFTTVTKSPVGLNYDQNDGDAADNITRLALAQLWPAETWSSLTSRALFQAEKLHKIAERQSTNFMLIKTQRDLSEWQKLRKTSPRLVGGLQKMQALSIVVDVSHSSEQVVSDVLAISKRPVVVSHTGFKGHCDTARNIPDQLMQDIAAQGGLIAVGYWDAAACNSHPRAVAQAIAYGIDLVGDDHVALGSDFDGSVTTSIDASELSAITHELVELNVPEKSIRKVMGLNMLRLLETQLPQ